MFTVTFKQTARKELYALPDKIIKRIAVSIDALSVNPRPAGVKKMKGKKENLWRLRVGDYRIIYVIEEAVQIVNIRRIGHRKEVYE